MTENRVGRSIYWAMTTLCRGKERPSRRGQAVEAVRQGKYLVRPRPESWNRPEPTHSCRDPEVRQRSAGAGPRSTVGTVPELNGAFRGEP